MFLSWMFGVPVVVTASETILIPNPELVQPDVYVNDLFTLGASPTPSPSKRYRSDSPFTYVGEGYLKRACLVKDDEWDALSPFV